MENVVINGYVYDNLYRFSNYILKFSSNSVEAWDLLCTKNLSFLNVPDYHFSVSNSDSGFSLFFSKVYLPFLYNYSTLYDLNFKFSDYDILLLLRNMLDSLRIMHASDVYHGDIFSKNVMVNDKLDFSFIDLDACIVDDIVSIENTYCDYNISLDDKKDRTIIDDKMNVLNLFLHYFIEGNFKIICDYNIDYDRLGFPKSLLDEIKSYSLGNIPSRDYYFMDVVDELISSGYCFTK